MLLWHYNITSWQIHSLENFFYFFLPWFYFKSGMLSKIEALNSKSIKNWGEKLLFPYLIYTAWGGVIALITAWCNGSLNLLTFCGTVLWQTVYLGSSWYNKPVWFLLTLFLCKFICSFCADRLKPLYLMIIAFFIAYLHSWLCNEQLNWIGNTSLAIVFYMSGHILRDIQWKSYIWIPSLIVYIATFVFTPVNIDARSNVLYYGTYPIGVFTAILGCISINNIIPKTNISILRPMTWIGRNSLLIMVFHYPLISPIRSFVSCFCTIEPINNSLVALIVSASTFLYIKLISFINVSRNNNVKI